MDNLIIEDTFNSLFKRHENQTIILPDKFYPNISFLDKHLKSVFNG